MQDHRGDLVQVHLSPKQTAGARGVPLENVGGHGRLGKKHVKWMYVLSKC